VRWLNLLLGQLGQHEGVNGIRLVRRRLAALGLLQRPPFLFSGLSNGRGGCLGIDHGALFDPRFQGRDVGGFQRAAQGHGRLSQTGDMTIEQALFRVAGNHGGTVQAAFLHAGRCAQVQPRELLRGAVASQAFALKQRLDLPRVGDLVLRLERRGEGKSDNKDWRDRQMTHRASRLRQV
jgi:hypothetical protein